MEIERTAQPINCQEKLCRSKRSLNFEELIKSLKMSKLITLSK